MKRANIFAAPVAAVVLAFSSAQMHASPDFAREVRPILSQHCFKCHGPDAQKGGVRFDLRESVTKAGKSELIPVVPGKPEESELLLRVSAPGDDADAMPPREGGNKPLTQAQIDTLRAWIAAGAEYRPHWAYVPPQKTPLPRLDGGSSANPVDAFIRARLEKEKLPPARQAAPAHLARRLHLDLVGLPPTPEEVDAFVQSSTRDPQTAVESLVDRLLVSPRFGEKWGRAWLDLARYGDTAGYQHDDDMPLWPYRDWVIRALNADMPFDQFTREQIAGDLLPGATLDQRIATGFNRAATVTLGADQNVDELRAMLVWDRVNTMGTTFLATTLECAQCHTHKFDPITDKDYYSLYAYFNRTEPELTRWPGSHYFITGGVLEMPASGDQQAHIAQLKEAMKAEIAAMCRVEFDFSVESEAVGPLRRIVQGPPELREPERVYYFLTVEMKSKPPEKFAAHVKRLRELGRELTASLPPRSLVLEESPNPPPTYLFKRGNVRTLGERLDPAPPTALHPLPPGAHADRRGLAEWLVSRENPLTARVVVNRWWAELFGQGIVTTPEDFGMQGEFPTHPELLDWLAVEFMEGGWRMKRLIRLMVTSQTYQQTSHVTPTALERDPQNRLLARGPRQRLVAELIRDNALAIGGLLEHAVGGAPLRATPEDAKKAGEPFAWRRSIYLRQQRGNPYATFLSFDAPDRFACTVQRPSTNTPLQALATLNEPVFLAAAEGLARRTAEIAAFEARLTRMYRLAIARVPRADEVAAFRELAAAAEKEGADVPTTWRLIANVVLNLDETLTKG